MGMSRIIKEFYEYAQLILSMFPGKLGEVLRRVMYKIFLKNVGRNFYTSLRIRIQGYENISIGNNVAINDCVWIAANKHKDGAITIGDNVLIGPFTVIHSGNHIIDNPNELINRQGFRFSPILIDADVWIAAQCTILSGVHIGRGAVIAAGSLVNKDIAPYTIVAGVPAKPIGKRN